MGKFRTVVLALAGSTAAVLALTATGAEANGRRGFKDDPYQPPIWTGAYIGAHIGGVWADYQVTGDSGAFDEAGSESISLEPRSFIGGFQAGYNVQAGGLIVGIEADISFSSADDSFAVVASPDNFARATLGTHGTLTTRVGLPYGQFLPYVKGGLAWARVNVNAGDLDSGVPDPADETRASKTLTGFAVGAGLEYAFTPNLTARAEYLFMDFRSFSTTNQLGETFNHELDAHSVRFGLNYKLGR